MKNYILITIFLLLSFYSQSQIRIDSSKQRICFTATLDKNINDSLLEVISLLSYRKACILIVDSLPSLEISKLGNIEELEIAGRIPIKLNFISEELTSLKKINIYSRLECINFGTGIKSLRELSIINAGLKEIPKSISYCSNLTYLSLSNNEITNLENLNKLVYLESLVLDQNKITEFPNCILKHKNLTKLNLDFNPLKSIPVSILKMKQLKTLNVICYPPVELPTKLLEQEEIEVVY